MTGLDKSQYMSGMQLAAPSIRFKSSFASKGGVNGGNAGNMALIPSSFYVKKVSEKLRLGFSLTAPLGGGLDYNDSFSNPDDDFVGRYGATKSLLAGIAFSPSFGYKVNDKFSIGGGVSVIYTRFDQDIAINQGPLPDGKVELDKLTGLGYQPFDRPSSSIYGLLAPSGGIRPPPRHRARLALTFSEREEISRGIACALSLRTIANKLGRSASTISREVNRNGGLQEYRASEADLAAWDRAC